MSGSDDASKIEHVVNLTFNPEAEVEYEDALEWYFQRNPRVADRFEAAIDQAIAAIKAHPTTFPLCDHIHRFVLVGRFPYIIVYRVDGNETRVIAVAHAKRRPAYWSNRK